jgi:hypothetical protein
MVDYTQAILSVNQQIGRMKVTVTKHTRNRGKLSRDIVEFGLEFGSFGMALAFASQTSKIVFHKEVEFP